jgi:hypothetical protein
MGDTACVRHRDLSVKRQRRQPGMSNARERVGCGREAGGAKNWVGAILRHRHRMAQSSEWPNALRFSARMIQSDERSNGVTATP